MNHDFHDARARVLVCGVGAVGCEALEKVALSLGDAAAADDEALFLAGTCAQRDQMEDALRQADLLIVLADLGSAMGRGATKALFAIAGDHPFATVACVVLPEADHGVPRVASALAALDEIAHDVDAYLSVREGRIRDLPEDGPARTAGAVFAEVVYALARPILFPAAVPLDFADIMVFLNCQAFIRKLRQMGEGVFRLPTEAEWEYACRAGTTTPFYFGETISTDRANYDGNHTYGIGRKGLFRATTTPVGSFPANAWGAHDMHGNLWEWCEDDKHYDYIGAPTDGSAWVDSPRGSRRMLRGGSWNSLPRYCRSADRRSTPGFRSKIDGFRIVRTP